MTHETSRDAAVDVRGYLGVFATLLMLTILTVAVSALDLPRTPAIALGLAIAAVKAALVALFFMHLRHERAAIFLALALTAVLVAGLFAFTLWTEADHVPGTEFTHPFSPLERRP